MSYPQNSNAPGEAGVKGDGFRWGGATDGGGAGGQIPDGQHSPTLVAIRSENRREFLDDCGKCGQVAGEAF